MDWSTLSAALLGIVGVLVGAYLTARLTRAVMYADWRRNHLYELYVELLPVVPRIQGALNRDQVQLAELKDLREQLDEFSARANVLRSDVRYEIIRMYEVSSTRLPPWFLEGEERRTYRAPTVLGTRTLTAQFSTHSLQMMQRELGPRQKYGVKSRPAFGVLTTCGRATERSRRDADRDRIV
jgi:hypothetical protein